MVLLNVGLELILLKVLQHLTLLLNMLQLRSYFVALIATWRLNTGAVRTLTDKYILHARMIYPSKKIVKLVLNGIKKRFLQLIDALMIRTTQKVHLSTAVLIVIRVLSTLHSKGQEQVIVRWLIHHQLINSRHKMNTSMLLLRDKPQQIVQLKMSSLVSGSKLVILALLIMLGPLRLRLRIHWINMVGLN